MNAMKSKKKQKKNISHHWTACSVYSSLPECVSFPRCEPWYTLKQQGMRKTCFYFGTVPFLLISTFCQYLPCAFMALLAPVHHIILAFCFSFFIEKSYLFYTHDHHNHHRAYKGLTSAGNNERRVVDGWIFWTCSSETLHGKDQRGLWGGKEERKSSRKQRKRKI